MVTVAPLQRFIRRMLGQFIGQGAQGLRPVQQALRLAVKVKGRGLLHTLAHGVTPRALW
ncbi:hypothetical protein PANO111632_05080 [Paracoccus nototheniae]